MSDTYPKILYKYANWDDKYHKKIILDNEIYFASAMLFNDPFDSDVPFRYDLRSDEDNFKIIKQLVRKNSPELDESQIDIESNNILKQRNWEREENKNNAELLRVRFMFHQKRILSLSSIKENILMWSHYANSHRGFCVGIDVKRIEEYFEKYNDDTKCPITLHKVKYERLFPILILGPDFNDPRIVIDALTTKAEDWKYEREWRYVLTLTEELISQKDFALRLPSGIISEIILGCRIAEEHKSEIIRILKRKSVKPKLFKAERSKDSFSLQIEELPLG